MKKAISIKLFLFLLVINIFSIVHAGSYTISKLTHIHTSASGKVSIKWQNSPNPGPCGGTNHGWVAIEPTADNALKSFVYTLYISAKPAVVTTSGCVGAQEIVTGIYSPGG